MRFDYSDAQWVGVAFVFLGLVLALAWLVRRYVPPFAALLIPTSVIAGFVILLIGPQMLGAWTGTGGLIPGPVLDTWRSLPGIMINIVFAAIMLGKTLPAIRDIWDQSAGHFILGSVLSFGQFALGALAVVFILTPLFGLTDLAGSILELSFAGGHGTIAGMGPLLADAGAPEVVDLGLGLATISMITGILGGSFLLRYAIGNDAIPVARKAVPTAAEDRDLDLHIVRLAPDDVAAGPDGAAEKDTGISPVTAAFMFIGLAVAVAILILETLRLVVGALGSDVFDKFPLFPFTVIGGFVVQAVMTRLGQAHLVDRTAVAGIAVLALDFLIAAAIGTMSLAALGANLPALVILTVIAVIWSVVVVLFLAPRIFERNWFEHSLADFGQSQGNVATGFVLADMADPDRRTNVANAYGYKQLTYEPLLGGGLITAFSIPMIIAWGSLAFGLVCLVITAALAAWGIRRKRSAAR
jgi:ESS family glutamate:Na+ symporter